MGHCAASRPADSQPLVGTPLVSLQLRPAPAGCQSNAAGKRGGQAWRAQNPGASKRPPLRGCGGAERPRRQQGGTRRRSGGAPGGTPSVRRQGPRERRRPRTAAALLSQARFLRRADMAFHQTAVGMEEGRGRGHLAPLEADMGRAAAARSDTAASRPAFRFLRKSRGGYGRCAIQAGDRPTPFRYTSVLITALPPCEGSGIASYRLCP